MLFVLVCLSLQILILRTYIFDFFSEKPNQNFFSSKRVFVGVPIGLNLLLFYWLSDLNKRKTILPIFLGSQLSPSLKWSSECRTPNMYWKTPLKKVLFYPYWKLLFVQKIQKLQKFLFFSRRLNSSFSETVFLSFSLKRLVGKFRKTEDSLMGFFSHLALGSCYWLLEKTITDTIFSIWLNFRAHFSPYLWSDFFPQGLNPNLHNWASVIKNCFEELFT